MAAQLNRRSKRSVPNEICPNEILVEFLEDGLFFIASTNRDVELSDHSQLWLERNFIVDNIEVSINSRRLQGGPYQARVVAGSGKLQLV